MVNKVTVFLNNVIILIKLIENHIFYLVKRGGLEDGKGKSYSY